jgi:hypothetical protein
MCEVHDQAHDSVVHRAFTQTVDKGLVGLQAVHRKILHLVQRLETAAEIVEGYSYSERPRISEHTDSSSR